VPAAFALDGRTAKSELIAVDQWGGFMRKAASKQKSTYFGSNTERYFWFASMFFVLIVLLLGIAHESRGSAQHAAKAAVTQRWSGNFAGAGAGVW
jgi:preprotein translocase subunit SecG